MTKPHYPLFLSIVCVFRDSSKYLSQSIQEITDTVSPLVADFEIIVVDNASRDESLLVLKRLIDEEKRPNLQVYALTKEVDFDTAVWAGLENSIGDFTLVIDPLFDDIKILPQLLETAVMGNDVVLAKNSIPQKNHFFYRILRRIFISIYAWASQVNLDNEAPQYRLLSKKVINFILQHSHPAIIYRHIPATGGFAKAKVEYKSEPKVANTKNISSSFENGMRLLVSTTRAPMRLVTSISLLGAFANLLYSVYVVLIAVFKQDVAPGWVSLSLQQSGMFFLISLVLLILGEYILNVARLSNEGPLYHIGQEMISSRITRREKLNVEFFSNDNSQQ